MITVSQRDLHHHCLWSQRRQHLSQGSAEATYQHCGREGLFCSRTCHLLLQLSMFKASHDFIVLSLDGSHVVEDKLEEEGQCATALSIVDHYMGRPNPALFNSMTLLEFARQYSMPKTLGAEPTHRSRRIVVVSPDPAGKYEQYLLW